jgi:hypothetical protein
VRGKLPLLAGEGNVIELAAALVGTLSHLLIFFSCYSKIRGVAGTGLADMLFARTQPVGY